MPVPADIINKFKQGDRVTWYSGPSPTQIGMITEGPYKVENYGDRPCYVVKIGDTARLLSEHVLDLHGKWEVCLGKHRVIHKMDRGDGTKDKDEYQVWKLL